MDEAKRAAKEQFVAGHSGGTLWDNERVILILALAYASWRSISPILYRFARSPASRLFLEYILLVVPMILSLTLTQYSDTLMMVLSATFCLGLILPNNNSSTTSKSSQASTQTQPPLQHKPYSVAFRATLQILTVVAILAVDFQVFPRKFAKCETYGTSMMDLGVGGFIFSGGFVAGPRLNRIFPARRLALQNVGKSFWTALPVLILGIVRFLATKGVNYQEHVTEYGVHWNFFFTLSLIPIFVALFQLLAGGINHAILGGAVLIGYQWLLNQGLAEYILYAPREGSLFQLNREGVCSFAGYLAIFLFASHVGYRTLSPTVTVTTKAKSQDENEKKGKPESSLSDEMAGYVQNLVELLSNLAMVSIMFVVTRYERGIFVSRRLANASYVLWVCSSAISFLVVTVALDMIVYMRGRSLMSTPVLFTVVNKNSLAVFLVANVLTGLVNLSIDTLSVSDGVALGIIGVYVAVVVAVAVLVQDLPLNLKYFAGRNQKVKLS